MKVIQEPCKETKVPIQLNLYRFFTDFLYRYCQCAVAVSEKMR